VTAQQHPTPPGRHPLGGVYLLHFDQRYEHAGHYTGFAESSAAEASGLLKRLGEHQHGRGARLVEVVTQAGITFRLARTWPGVTRARERQLKLQGGASRRCPICLDQPAVPGQRHDQTTTQPGQAVPTRGTTPAQARAFLELNEKFARPVGASPAKQWGRVRGREQVELLTPRVTGAWFEENAQPSQHPHPRGGAPWRPGPRPGPPAPSSPSAPSSNAPSRWPPTPASAPPAASTPLASDTPVASARRTPMSAEQPTSQGVALSPAEANRLHAVLCTAAHTLATDPDQRLSQRLDQADHDLTRRLVRAERASVRLDAPVRLDAEDSARVLGLLGQAAARLDALADHRERERYLVGPGYFRKQATAARAWRADLGELAARQADHCQPERDRAEPDREDGREG
jgi:hypothetical protein